MRRAFALAFTLTFAETGGLLRNSTCAAKTTGGSASPSSPARASEAAGASSGATRAPGPARSAEAVGAKIRLRLFTSDIAVVIGIDLLDRGHGLIVSVDSGGAYFILAAFIPAASSRNLNTSSNAAWTIARCSTSGYSR